MTRRPRPRFRLLANRRSPRWAFMERFEVPDYRSDDPERTYLTRWRLVQTPWFGLYLHRLDGPDPSPTLHDHPWSFVSIILKGGYVETFVADPWRKFAHDGPVDRMLLRWAPKARVWRPGSVHLMRARDGHFIEVLARTPTWTLLLVGPRWREWGYWDEAGWTQYDLHPIAREFDAAMAARKRLRGEL